MRMEAYGDEGGCGIAITWKRGSGNESMALHRIEINMERWKLYKDLDQEDIPVSHVKGKEKIMECLCDKIIAV